MTALNIDVVASDDGPWLLRVSGELDLETAAALRCALDCALAQRRAVVVDVRRLQFLDSTGLSALLKARQTAGLRMLDFRVEGPHGAVARVMGRTGTLKLLTTPTDPVASA